MPAPSFMELMSAAHVAGPSMYVSDSFDRTNSASTMGNTDSAYGGTTATWVPLGGSTWGIASNKAYGVVTNQSIVYVETSQADCTVEVTISVEADSGLAWRVTDIDNHWLFNQTGGAGNVYKKVAGGFSAVASIGTVSNGDVMKVVLSGSNHTIYKNGISVASYSDAFNASATKHGLRDHANGGVRFDDFKVYP